MVVYNVSFKEILSVFEKLMFEVLEILRYFYIFIEFLGKLEDVFCYL